MQVKPALGLFHSHQVPRENGRVSQHGLRRRPGSPIIPSLPYPKSLSAGEGGIGEISTHSASWARRKNGEAQGRGTGRRE